MVVTIAHLLQLLEEGVYHRILVIASGALLSPVALQQKDTIPCIAHVDCLWKEGCMMVYINCFFILRYDLYAGTDSI